MPHRVLAIFRRRLFTCLTILSLLLCLATLALWVRSYWCSDEAWRWSQGAHGSGSLHLWNAAGELVLVNWHSPYIPPHPQHGWSFRTIPPSAWYAEDFARNHGGVRSVHFILGFGFGHASNREYRTTHYVAPHWFIALLFAVLPAIKLRSLLLTRHRDRAGLCHHCGYDLRATAPGSVCPECGQLTTRPPPAATSPPA